MELVEHIFGRIRITVLRPKFLRNAFIVSVLIGYLLLGLYSCWQVVEAVCITTQIEEKNVSGYVIGTTVETCIADASATFSVLAAQAGRKKIETLFAYDSGPDYYFEPTITEVSPHRIRISVLSVSQIYKHLDAWQGLTIDYDIGYIAYPRPSDPIAAAIRQSN